MLLHCRPQTINLNVGHLFAGRATGSTSERHMSGRQILFSLSLLSVAAIAWLAVRPSTSAWLLGVAVAGVGGLAAGIAWERRWSARFVAENEHLKRQAEQQSAELTQAKKLSGEQKTEAAQALRDSEALYHSLVDHL